ncbi:MAG TPA: cytochrome c [Candidatus Acidoferrales bacterium]|jgi:cytochrome c6|nr:cytochrome c [Candidatus Acidoferrales bacterium]
MNRSLVRITRSLILAGAVVFLVSMSARADDSATLFKSKCSVCHGAAGKGDAPAGKKLGARDLSSPEVQNQSDAQLTEIVTKGKGKMPAYGKTLKDDEIKGLVAYIRELAKKK